MDIKELTENYTREEFLKQLEKSNYSSELYGIFQKITCPFEVGLPKHDDCKLETTPTCKECWLNAIKDIQFKNELTKDDKYNLSKEEMQELYEVVKECLEYDIKTRKSLYNALLKEENELEEKLYKITENRKASKVMLGKRMNQLEELKIMFEKEGR